MKIAVVILAHPENHGALARAVNAMELVKEAKQTGDDVALVLDGAGTMWGPLLSDDEHRYHDLFQSVSDRIVAVCDYCAGIFGVKDEVAESNLPLTAEFDDHPSLRSLLAEGYQMVTF